MSVGYEAQDLAKFTAEQAPQVHHVDALIKQHASAGNLAFRAPVPLIEGDELRLAVHAAHVDHVAEFTGAQDLQRILHRLMVAMIEPIHEFQARVLPLTGDHTHDVLYTSAGWLFTENVQAILQPGDRHFRSDVIGQADEQYIQVLCQQTAIVAIVPDAIRQRTFVGKIPVAYRHHPHAAIAADAVFAARADDTKPGDADLEDIHWCLERDPRASVLSIQIMKTIILAGTARERTPEH